MRLVRSFRPDVVNVHFPDAQIPFVLWLRRRWDFRLVVSLHGNDVEQAVPGTLRPSSGPRKGRSLPVGAILREADAVTACSRYLLDRAVQLEPAVAGKGHAIPNGISPERFQAATRTLHSRPYLLAYGRLTPVKGFDLLLDAFARLAPRFPAVDLLLAGEGPERAALEVQAERMGVARQVRFYGRAQPDEVVALLNGALFVAVPSRSEAFGITALEALAAGKPVLATRVGGLPELLPAAGGATAGGSLRLVEATAEGLAQGLQQWLGPGGLPRVARESGRSIRDQYSWGQIARRYEEVLMGAGAA
jgi:glycosyltransferase involved in cell wall biosynthesis